MRKSFIGLLLFLAFFRPIPVCASDPSAKLLVAAASDLAPAMPELAAAFERAHGLSLRISLGASGNLSQQIQHGAPYDVFLSADLSYAQALVDRSLASELTHYAAGPLALWMGDGSSRTDGACDHPPAGSNPLHALTADRIRRIAVANPMHAPYGAAAVAALRRGGVYEQVRSKLVLGENAAQTAQFARSGSVSAALIPVGHAQALPAGACTILPSELAPPLAQCAVLLTSSRRAEAARHFLRFLQSAEAQGILRRFGFLPAEAR